MAAFTQLTYHVGEKTHLDGGVRFNHESIDATFVNTTPTANPPANNASCLSVCSGKAKDDHVTYKVALRQDLAEHVMALCLVVDGLQGPGLRHQHGLQSRAGGQAGASRDEQGL